MTALGVYVGNDPSAILRFEHWLGRPVDGILGYTGDKNWSDYDGSVPWAIDLWNDIDRPVLWSVPLIPEGASLEEAATGAYNEHYAKAAQALAAFRPQDDVLYVRTGWEFNGSWFPWAAKGKEDAFIGAFRQFVDTFRSVSDRFKFDWCPNIGDFGMNPEKAYPGDAYVDVIGLDFYYNTKWDSSDPIAAWDFMVTRKYGLQWHQDFAAARGKSTAYSEWGVMSNNAGPYIERAAQWFRDHNVVYQTYWNSDSAFPGKLSDGNYPDAGAEFRQEFSIPSNTPGDKTDPLPDPAGGSEAIGEPAPEPSAETGALGVEAWGLAAGGQWGGSSRPKSDGKFLVEAICLDVRTVAVTSTLVTCDRAPTDRGMDRTASLASAHPVSDRIEYRLPGALAYPKMSQGEEIGTFVLIEPDDVPMMPQPPDLFA